MAFNLITADFTNGRTITTAPINYQYDAVQYLVITGIEDLPDNIEVDFCNDGDSSTITMTGTADGVRIPDDFLQSGDRIKAYIVLTGNETDVQTRYEATIPVRSRPTRTDITPTPAQQLQIDELVAAMNETVESAEQAAETASGYADDAEGSANDAAGSATLSESWAIGGTGTRSGEDTNNSKHYAEVAQQGAEESGYAWFNVDLNDGEMYVQISDNLDQDVSFAVNTAEGYLEVTIE